MRTRSATALGASLLVLAIPAVAGASTIGAIPGDLASAKVEGKVETGIPVRVSLPAGLPVKAGVDGRLHQHGQAKTKVGAKGLDVRQRTEVRSNTDLSARIKTGTGPARAGLRARQDVRERHGGDLAKPVAGSARFAKTRARHGVARTRRLAAHGRPAHRTAALARTGRRIGDRGHTAGHRVAKPLAAIGRQVGNTLHPELAGGLLLSLVALVVSLTRSGLAPRVRRG